MRKEREVFPGVTKFEGEPNLGLLALDSPIQLHIDEDQGGFVTLCELRLILGPLPNTVWHPDHGYLFECSIPWELQFGDDEYWIDGIDIGPGITIKEHCEWAPYYRDPMKPEVIKLAVPPLPDSWCKYAMDRWQKKLMNLAEAG